MSVRRKIWERRIKNFWEDFSHNKIGLVGLAILLFYIAVAFLTPVLGPIDPEQRGLAEQYAYPEWYANLNPALQNLPRTTESNLEWAPEGTIPENVNVSQVDNYWVVKFNGTETIRIPFYAKFNYPWDPPKSVEFKFTYSTKVGSSNKKATAQYSLELNITTPGNVTYSIWDSYWWTKQLYEQQISYEDLPKIYPSYPFEKANKTEVLVTMSPISYVFRLEYPKQNYDEMINAILGPPGDFTFKMYVTIKPLKENAWCEIRISKFEIKILGLVYGLLGTQVYGGDCWSRLIHGVRISLAVGLMAAVLSTTLGVGVGVIAGFLGGGIDEVLMRLVDVLICLPALPILMVLVTLFGRSVYYIVIIIAVFGWQGLSRLIRSQTLSIREMPFIECATASGASKFYIMARHIVPNIMPIALADMVLTIPGAIILEAALSFIGFGDPTTPTWGREFNLAFSEGSGFSQFIWWWIIPPGIAITTLCLGFVFISHAVDEIVNPRLRRRR